MIKRYYLDFGRECEEAPDGEWVKYEDHKSEVERIKDVAMKSVKEATSDAAKAIRKFEDQLKAAHQIIQSQAQVMKDQSKKINDLL